MTLVLFACGSPPRIMVGIWGDGRRGTICRLIYLIHLTCGPLLEQESTHFFIIYLFIYFVEVNEIKELVTYVYCMIHSLVKSRGVSAADCGLPDHHKATTNT